MEPTTETPQQPDWRADGVQTRSGRVVPVRATARRPIWSGLPDEVRMRVERRLGARVIEAESAGTGFTPGFASRLRLADGTDVFCKAASTADDRLHGWPLSNAYREEARKLSELGTAVGSPELLWTSDEVVAGEQWVVLCFRFVDARPPRRPWTRDELGLVVARLEALAPVLAEGAPALGLQPVAGDLVDGFEERLEQALSRGADAWLIEVVRSLCLEAEPILAGTAVVHGDLRDDNILVSDAGQVWIVDWNWPVLGVPWIDLVCLLLSARGDGHDADEILTASPLTRDVDPHEIDVLLGVLWSFWAAARHEEAPTHSPHLRDHQEWYADVTEGWLRERLAGVR